MGAPDDLARNHPDREAAGPRAVRLETPTCSKRTRRIESTLGDLTVVGRRTLSRKAATSRAEGTTPLRSAPAPSIRPEFGTVSRPDLVRAAREAADAGFDAVIVGEPDIDVPPVPGDESGPERITVRLNGVDVFDPTPVRSAATTPMASPTGSSTPTTTKKAPRPPRLFPGRERPYKALKAPSRRLGEPPQRHVSLVRAPRARLNRGQGHQPPCDEVMQVSRVWLARRPHASQPCPPTPLEACPWRTYLVRPRSPEVAWILPNTDTGQPRRWATCAPRRAARGMQDARPGWNTRDLSNDGDRCLATGPATIAGRQRHPTGGPCGRLLVCDRVSVAKRQSRPSGGAPSHAR